MSANFLFTHGSRDRSYFKLQPGTGPGPVREQEVCAHSQGGEMMAHHTRPLIGINADFVPAGKNTRAQLRIPVGYFESVLAAGGLPVVMPLLGKEQEIDAFLDRVDGFILTG